MLLSCNGDPNFVVALLVPFFMYVILHILWLSGDFLLLTFHLFLLVLLNLV